MNVLVDTSIWIEYFRNGCYAETLEPLIDDNLVATNHLILAEMIPFLKIKKQTKLIGLLRELRNLPLVIDWNDIIEFQYRCLKNGINGIGIPDLLIVQNALQNKCPIFTQDKHFSLAKDVLDFEVIDSLQP